MVRVTNDLSLSPDTLTLYHASDPLLGHLPILIFHGPSTTANYTLNTSRVQLHIFSPAGFQSFPRITISPSSPFYGAVNQLPREIQVDEVYRGLAFGLLKFFKELPDGVKSYLKAANPTRGQSSVNAPALFGEQHAANLVTAMVKSENAAEVISSLHDALQAQNISNVDVDLVLPPGAITTPQLANLEDVPDDEDDILDPTLKQYGRYTPLIKLFGEPVFLPTTRLRRAPSKPTSLNRGRSFTKDQQYELRMKLAELVDTEERYVLKLQELVHRVAKDFRESAKAKPEASLSPSEEQLERLFPHSAEEILRLNSAFVDQLRMIREEPNNEAAERPVGQTTASMGSIGVASARSKDPSGALGMARLFLEWFPKFTQSYQDYIKASQHFPTWLNSFLEPQSSFTKRVNQTGEQAIRSILIEPVQRLPRYSLLIDQIVGLLPITHPALQPMLKARDIITNICSMDDPLPDRPCLSKRLRNMVELWPENLEPQGRLIAAADFDELAPPFQLIQEQQSPGVFLLFSGCVVLLKRTGATMTGRDLLREIDKPSAAELLISMTNAAGGPSSYQFVFAGWHQLADLKFTESLDGSLVWMTSIEELKDAHAGEYKVSKAATSRCFHLQEAYRGKASKWSEDVVKAKIEARFSETEREDPRWTLRSVRMQDSNLGFHFAVFQEGAHELIEGRREPASIRVVVDHERGTKGAPLGHYGVEAVVNLWSKDMKRVSILTDGLKGRQFQDEIDLEDFLPTASRRIIQLLSTQFNVGNAQLTAPLVSYYTRILRGLKLSTNRAEKTRSFLASSPVKLLSSFWHGGSNTNSPDVVISGVAKPQSQPSLHRANSIHSMFGSIRGKDSRPTTAEAFPENPLLKLEQTFAGFVEALQSRKGAIIGRTILNRSLADELSVNYIYNRFIENPDGYEVASDIGIEVVFVAFEKFLHIAWAEQMGPIMTVQIMDVLLERANKRVPGDFADFVNYLLRDVAPQNRRAFIVLIGLLADLLEACSNDGDRGALTIAFAELIVSNDKAHNYINLLDRLVEVCDRIFDGQDADQGSNQSFYPTSSISESIASSYRGKAHTGSITSNASSLRRKFGLDALLRQNSKDERQSVWRSMSKHRNPATGDSSSLSRGTLDRTRSIDDSSLPKKLHRRAMSRDRPPIAGAFDAAPHRPGSSHRMEFPLDTIGEPSTAVNPMSSKNHKKKRRSSLSDLKSLMASASLEDDEHLQPLQATKQTSGKVNASPKAPSPSKIPISPSAAEALRSSRQQKENLIEASVSSSATVDNFNQLATTRIAGHSKTFSMSNIPTLKPKSASGSDNAHRPGSPTRSGAQRLRLHSPQRLRERLQSEKEVVQEIDTSLQSELSKIEAEMAKVSDTRTASSRSVDIKNFSASIKELESRVIAMMQGLNEQQASTQREVEETLRKTEAKVRAIDQLYKEVVAENELLYEKFNGELDKIIKAVKGKGRDDKEELVAKVKQQGEEMMRVKKENGRLKREIVSLKALLKSAE